MFAGIDLKNAVATGSAALLALLAAPLAWASKPVDMVGGPAVNQLNLHAPATKIAADIYDLHTGMLIVCTLIFVAVFGAMFYSVYAHRKSKGHKAEQFHESIAVEIAWTVIPTIIVILMAAFATKTVLAMKDTSNADITIKATGYQWKWGYDYLKGEGEGISFMSNMSTPREQIDGTAPKGENYMLEVDNEVVVPVNKKVRVILTAQDVIHAWMIPSFGVKQDAVPGFIRDAHFKADRIGKFRGQCAELCGKEHGFMPIVVNVVSDADYTKWVGEEKKKLAARQDDPNKVWTTAELTARGEKVYAANCVACHQANGKGVPPAFPPLEGAKMVNGPMDHQIAILLNGRTGSAMAAFKQLSDVELAAVTAYTRTTWGNKGEVPTVADIKAARAWDAAKMIALAAKQP